MQQGRLNEAMIELRRAERNLIVPAPTIGLIGVWFHRRGEEEQALAYFQSRRCSIRTHILRSLLIYERGLSSIERA